MSGLPDTRPVNLGDREIAMIERIAQIMGALQRPSGAQVSTGDSRVDILQKWFLCVCVTGCLGLLAWSINALVQQGIVQAQTVTQMQALEQRMNRLEDRRP